MIRLAVLTVILAAFVVSASWQAPGDSTLRPMPALRFHHLHYRVGDPSAAMRHAAETFQGSRVLLRGLGVGVRIGSEYVLFDRADATELQRPSPEAVFNGAVEWIRRHGLPAPGGGIARARIAAEFLAAPLDHVAFMSPDMPRAIAILGAHGAIPVRQTGDAALFDARGGVAVEIVRDTDADDAYWCPMHPDLRSATAEKCPLCGPLARCPPRPASGSIGWTSLQQRARVAPACRSCG